MDIFFAKDLMPLTQPGSSPQAEEGKVREPVSPFDSSATPFDRVLEPMYRKGEKETLKRAAALNIQPSKSYKQLPTPELIMDSKGIKEATFRDDPPDGEESNGFFPATLPVEALCHPLTEFLATAEVITLEDQPPTDVNPESSPARLETVEQTAPRAPRPDGPSAVAEEMMFFGLEAYHLDELVEALATILLDPMIEATLPTSEDAKIPLAKALCLQLIQRLSKEETGDALKTAETSTPYTEMKAAQTTKELVQALAQLVAEVDPDSGGRVMSAEEGEARLAAWAEFLRGHPEAINLKPGRQTITQKQPLLAPKLASLPAETPSDAPELKAALEFINRALPLSVPTEPGKTIEIGETSEEKVPLSEKSLGRDPFYTPLPPLEASSEGEPGAVEEIPLALRNFFEGVKSPPLAKMNTSQTVPRTEDLFQQIVQKAELALKAGHQEMEIQLKPSFLGKLKLNIALENGLITARFMAESAQVKQIIEANLPQLKQTLEEQNLQLDRLEVTLDNGSSNPRGQPRDPYSAYNFAETKDPYPHLGGVPENGLSEAAQYENTVFVHWEEGNHFNYWA